MNKAQLLHAAALAVISDPERWTQNVSARDVNNKCVSVASSDAVCWCSSGALDVVSNLGWDHARKKVIEALILSAVPSEIYNFVKYNDTHTHDEVMTMWQRAGTILEQTT